MREIIKTHEELGNFNHDRKEYENYIIDLIAEIKNIIHLIRNNGQDLFDLAQELKESSIIKSEMTKTLLYNIVNKLS